MLFILRYFRIYFLVVGMHYCAEELNEVFSFLYPPMFIISLLLGLCFYMPCLDEVTVVDMRTLSFAVPPQEVGLVAAHGYLCTLYCAGRLYNTFAEGKVSLSPGYM